MRWKIHFQVHSHAFCQTSLFCWLLARGHTGYSLGLLTTWHLASPQVSDPRHKEQKRTSEMEARTFYDLTSETTSHHFCYLSLVTQTNLGTVREGTTRGCKYQEVGISGCLLGEWLPHCESRHYDSPLLTCCGNTHALNGTFKKEKLRVPHLRDGVPRPWGLCLPIPPKPKTHIISNKNLLVILKGRKFISRLLGSSQNLQGGVKTSQLVHPTPANTGRQHHH